MDSEYLTDVEYYDYSNLRAFYDVNVALSKIATSTAIHQVHKFGALAVDSGATSVAGIVTQIHKFVVPTVSALSGISVEAITQSHVLHSDVAISVRSSTVVPITQTHKLLAEDSTRHNNAFSTLVFPSEYYIEDGQLFAVCGSNPDVAIVGTPGPEVSVSYTLEAMSLVDGYLILTS
jgi:hypothetical protein